MSEQAKTKLEIVQDRINQYDVRFPVATLAKELNLNKGYVSGVLSGQKPISDNFWETFNKKYPQKDKFNGHTPDLPPDTKQLYERWLADKEKTQQQFHATNQGLIDLLKNKLDEIATNLMTGQYQLKEQLFAVGESLGQQLDGISSGLAAKDRPVEQPVKKDKGVSGRQKESDGKDKSH